MNFYLDSDSEINIKEVFYMSSIILIFLFIGIPVGIIIFFIMSLLEFKGTPKDHLYYKKRKKKLIVSAVLMGIILASVIGLFIMISISLTHM